MVINEVFLGLNKTVKRIFFLIAIFFIAVQVRSQDDVEVITNAGPPKTFGKISLPRVNMRASCTIPKITSSQALRISFRGVYDAQLSLNFRVADNLNIGLGYKNAYFLPQLYFRQKGLDTRLQIHDAFARIGYDRMFSRGFVNFSVDAGYSYNQYTNVRFSQDSLNGKNPTAFGAYFLRPEISIYFLVEESFAFGFTFSYNYCLYNYNTIYNGFGSYADSKSTASSIIYEGTHYKNKANMGWFSFGFGFYFGFKKKTKG